MLKGDLSSFSLGEIFQSLAINNHTGTLSISARARGERHVYFVDGAIRCVSRGKAVELGIGEVFVRMGRITVEDLDEARATQSVGMTLLRRGLVTKEDVVSALKRKICEELYDLFLWEAGHFEFAMNSCPEGLFDDLQTNAPINVNTNSVIMEGLRRVDEWGILRTKIATLDEIFERTEARNTGDLEELDANFLQRIDGTTPVQELAKSYFGTRFELCKFLYDLLEAGTIRPISSDACIERAERFKNEKQPAVAIHLLRFAAQQNPTDPRLHERIGELQNASYQEEGARASFVEAIRLYVEAQDFESAAATSDHLMGSLHHLNESELQLLLDAKIGSHEIRNAVQIAGQLSANLSRSGDIDGAAAVLGRVVELAPDDLNLQIELGTLFQKANDKDRATAYFEKVATSLAREERHRDLLKILRILVNLDPKSVDLKQRLASTQSTIEKLERQRRRRITFAGIAAFGALAVLLTPVIYEIKARELFNRANRMEQVSMVSMDFTEAKSAYEELLRSFSFSTKVAEAQAALDRIAVQEKAHFSEISRASSENLASQKRAMTRRRDELKIALLEAHESEKGGEIAKAHDLYSKIRVEFKDLPETREILLPVEIKALPADAVLVLRVKASDEEIAQGKKYVAKRIHLPHVYHYEIGETLTFEIERRGCKTLSQELTLEDQSELFFELDRTPTATFQPTVGTHQRILPIGKRILVPARDGFLYAIDATKHDIEWKRRVGRFGDRASDIAAYSVEVYVGTLTGEVTAISTLNGKSRWLRKVDGPVYAAPAVAPNGSLVAVVTLEGSVHVIDNREGEELAKFETENSNVARPVFSEKELVVASTDNNVYVYSLADRKVAFELDLHDDIRSDPALIDSRLVVATNSGRIHGIDLRRRTLVWSLNSGETPSTGIVASGSSVAHVGTVSGKLITLNIKNGEVEHERILGSEPVSGILPHSGTVYATTAAGALFALHGKTNETTWYYNTDAMTLTNPTIIGNNLLVINANGRIVQFEVIAP